MRERDEEENRPGPALWIGAAGILLAALAGIAMNFDNVWTTPIVLGWSGTAALIGLLSTWLLLATAFAVIVGWTFASRRSARTELSLRRERDHLMRDLAAMAVGEGGPPKDDTERARAEEALRGQIDIRDARIADLEAALERARDSADDAASQIAELQRRIEKADADAQELARLRSLEEARPREQLVDVRAEELSPENEAASLQAWRLRYLEQRVRYLESLARPEPPASAIAPEPNQAPQQQDTAQLLAADWRAREAEARAHYLEQELRAREEAPLADEAPSGPTPPPFAANADVDILLRWRLLYLERRAAHLQAQAAQHAAQVETAAPREVPDASQLRAREAAPDPDRWKWRARYLEARVRHLEQRLAERAPLPEEPAQPVIARPPADEAEEPIRVPAQSTDRLRRKPPVLAAPRHGAPDDLTLIEGVSAMQQSTLYSIGVFHFDQIAAWTPENVAWIDNYLRLRGRIDDEEWVEQAAALARELAGA